MPYYLREVSSDPQGLALGSCSCINARRTTGEDTIGIFRPSMMLRLNHTLTGEGRIWIPYDGAGREGTFGGRGDLTYESVASI